ncbi:MAG: hypothetical protein MJ196_08740 [Treponemataceae bacterium]|nr:hypothetical protein [Treponemataceae bacterium]
MKKEITGSFVKLDGQDVYKIENYDQMENFFMTITSSSDIWNFCWSQGGITAGRINSNHSVFPYYTADKVSDASSYTGNYTSVAVKTADGVEYWEPFSSFYLSPSQKKAAEKNLLHNIYKNYSGTQVWFEEINTKLNLLFRTGWTSSEKYGLVRTSYIENLSGEKREIAVLDGCRNILPACCTSTFQNDNSVLLDAYKKTDLEEKSNIALFTVSSIVSDKAEPNEGLYANTCWFSTEDKIILAVDAPAQFIDLEKVASYADFKTENVSKGKRSSCYICRNLTLNANACDSWYQVFDTALAMTQVEVLKSQIKDRNVAVKDLEADIKRGNDVMTDYIKSADGIQDTADQMACLHHQQNVMFNIMRGGIFANGGKISIKDFLKFVNQRNIPLVAKFEGYVKTAAANGDLVNYGDFASLVKNTNDPQFTRLFLEYMPLTFSRRHGDPSRPWNIFNIVLKDREGNPILNYEGNWRDIFQNWEALVYSYPEYIKNMSAKFLNAMTADGFNPYKINRQGIDWEIPDPTNPWAQIGYWGDHQVIYFEKLLEFYNKTKRAELLASVNEKIYTSANVPYRIKSYADIVKNPRVTIEFDRELSDALKAAEAAKGSDAKLVQGADGNPYLVSFATKALQIVICKIANFIPAGGIWLNTQRPEWNDANNALAGYGLSVVTLCYLYRYIAQLAEIFESTDVAAVTLPSAVKKCFCDLVALYSGEDAAACAKDDKARKAFVEKAGKIFEAERNDLYKNGYTGEEELKCADIAAALKMLNKTMEHTIRLNKRADGLYHSYNTLLITEDGMKVEYLQEMLEGQVAILSSNLLSPEESLDLVKALHESRMYEPRQNSFMLYPNKELPAFYNKNCVSAADAASVASLIERTGTLYLEKDINGNYHFNPDFRNANVMDEFVAKQKGNDIPTDAEKKALFALYEKTFNHQSFTGRSGTFYAYEGLGSIYWHMCSKLLLAVQENLLKAYAQNKAELAVKLTEAYYEVRKGLGSNKTPEIYGAFPADPYSHTPYLQGAKQPGMTGQVKEEVLTRWGELGITIEGGIASFNPLFLKKAEIKADGTLNFTWCGVPVTYKFGKGTENYISVSGNKRNGNALTEGETKDLFLRQGKISAIEVEFGSCYGI